MHIQGRELVAKSDKNIGENVVMLRPSDTINSDIMWAEPVLDLSFTTAPLVAFDFTYRLLEWFVVWQCFQLLWLSWRCLSVTYWWWSSCWQPGFCLPPSACHSGQRGSPQLSDLFCEAWPHMHFLLLYHFGLFVSLIHFIDWLILVTTGKGKKEKERKGETEG